MAMIAQTTGETALGRGAAAVLGNSSLGSDRNSGNNFSSGGWEKFFMNMTPLEQTKKFNISSKLFKLRYLCKYHL
jgi:hypothetical protein